MIRLNHPQLLKHHNTITTVILVVALAVFNVLPTFVAPPQTQSKTINTALFAEELKDDIPAHELVRQGQSRRKDTLPLFLAPLGFKSAGHKVAMGDFLYLSPKFYNTNPRAPPIPLC